MRRRKHDFAQNEAIHIYSSILLHAARPLSMLSLGSQNLIADEATNLAKPQIMASEIMPAEKTLDVSTFSAEQVFQILTSEQAAL